MAVKIPGMMRRLGLSDIQVRLNDRVTVFPEENTEEETGTRQDFLEMNSWDQTVSEKEAGERIEYLMNHGMDRAEADAYVRRQQEIALALRQRGEAEIVHFTGLMVSTGRKNGRK